MPGGRGGKARGKRKRVCEKVQKAKERGRGEKGRIGFILLLIFLNRNGVSMTASDDEKIDFTLGIAQGKLDLNEIAS